MELWIPEPTNPISPGFARVENPHFYVRIHGDITTCITVYDDNVIRIQRKFRGAQSLTLPILQEDAFHPGALITVDDEPALAMEQGRPEPPRDESIQVGQFTISIEKDGCIGVINRGTWESFNEVSGRHLIRQDGRLIHSFQLDGCLHYGFGEKTGPLEKTGMRMRFAGKDACGYDPKNTDPLYKSVPFFIRMPPSGQWQMGVFYHTGAPCELDMGREVNGYYPPMGQFLTGEDSIDLFLFFGNTMESILDHFTRFTGRPALLPKYALGYLGSSMYYPELPEHCGQEILGFVQKAKQLGMDCSNFQLSSGYTTDQNQRRNVFCWNREKFPDPWGFVRNMERLGATVTPNVKPALLTTHPLYPIFQQSGAFIRNEDGSPYVTRFWGGEGSFVDFTNPKGRELWKYFLKKSLLDLGIRSIWNDNNEFDLTGGYCYNEGTLTPATKMAAVLPLLMARTGWEALEEAYPLLRPYQVSRSGCAGINRYAQVWTGDNRTSWDSLRWNIATMLGSGLSGMPNTGSDVGGFAGPAPDKELLLRWIACGAVMPRFSIHSANDDNTVTEPWMYESVIPEVQGFFALRQRLMPYLYTLHSDANFKGTPIWRPMFWHFPQDTRCQREDVDFMLGDALLCACVVEPGATQRRVWLPGKLPFYDVYTGERYEPNQFVTLEAPLGKLPLLQRGGTMFPTWEEDGLHLWVAPDCYCSFSYYDDDGLMKEPRDRVITNFTCSTYQAAELSCYHYCDRKEEFQVEMRCPHRAPAGVEADGKQLKRFMDYRQLRQADSGWYYDPERKIARIRGGLFQNLKVWFQKVDLIKMDTQNAFKPM